MNRITSDHIKSLTDLDNKATKTAVEKWDLHDSTFAALALEVRVEYGGDPGANMTFTIYWVTSGSSMTIAQALTRIPSSEWQNKEISLTSGKSDGDKELWIGPPFNPSGRYLYVAYTISNVTNAVDFVDFFLNKLHGHSAKILHGGKVFDGRKTVTAAGTAEALSSVPLKVKTLTVQAFEANTLAVSVGGATVVAADGTERGIKLFALSTHPFEDVDLNTIYVDAQFSGEGVSFAGIL